NGVLLMHSQNNKSSRFSEPTDAGRRKIVSELGKRVVELKIRTFPDEDEVDGITSKLRTIRPEASETLE
ncbi:MAG TPA: hypothetical protein VEU96_19270, partial [Bryobacteraceae bacterium]|nr:hypothetical protein [Bryobacteraceae bacterium]